MESWARIYEGLVAEIVSLNDDLRPGKDVFHPSLVFVKTAPGVEVGWSYDGTKFVAPAQESPSA